MKKLVELLLEDRSTKDRFLFGIRCGVCGLDCVAGPVRFSGAERPLSAGRKQVLQDAIYRQELEDARRRAVRAVAEQVSRCPVCLRIVCDRCFRICEELDLCSECAEAAGVTGIPVCFDDQADHQRKGGTCHVG